jgi:WD40 associated region in TFIID subunit, NTD2 domain
VLSPSIVSLPAQVLYPLFVNAYLDVVRKGHGARAREMMRKLKARFVDAGGASVSVANELDDLATVVYPQHLQNPVPRQVRLCPPLRARRRRRLARLRVGCSRSAAAPCKWCASAAQVLAASQRVALLCTANAQRLHFRCHPCSRGVTIAVAHPRMAHRQRATVSLRGMQILQKKTTIKMSRITFELLFQFIQREGIWTMMAICNQYLRFELQAKVQSAPRGTDALLLKDTGDEGLRINQGAVQLGLLRGGLEDQLITRAVNAVLDVRLAGLP